MQHLPLARLSPCAPNAVGCGRATRPGLPAGLPTPILQGWAWASRAWKAQEGQMLDFWRDIGRAWYPNQRHPAPPPCPCGLASAGTMRACAREWSRACTRSRLRPCTRPPGRAGTHPHQRPRETAPRLHGARPSAYAPECARVCAGDARVATSVPYRPGTSLASLSPLCRARTRGLARPLPW